MMHRLKMRGKVVFSRRILTSIISLFFVLCLSAIYQNVYAWYTSAVPPFVETEWLADNLKKPDIHVVYVGMLAEDDKAKFDKKHIPGSVYLDIESLMNVLGNGSMPPDKAKFEALMSGLGISNDTYIVVAGIGNGNPFITAVFWLVKYNGHEKISYLNGGITKWTQEKHETTERPAEIKSTTYKAIPYPSIFANADDVLQNIKNPKVAIVDTRGLDEYTGENALEGMNKRTGHIPGAIHLNFYPTNLNEDGSFKSVEDLRAIYESKGVTKDKEVLIYCQGGVRASHTYFVLKHLLGYPNVRNYVGSWGEWGNRLDPAKYPLEK